MKYLKYASLSVVLLILNSCTKLDENLYSNLTAEQAKAQLNKNVNFNAMLETVYRNFDNAFPGYDQAFGMEEMSSDEMIVPSRPSGWDNNGIFREMHQHTWTQDNSLIKSIWLNLNKGIFNSSNVLEFNPPKAVEAEARFLRAYFMFQLVDIFNQLPFREKGTNLLDVPKVYKGKEAIDFIISEVEAVINDLPANAPDYKASKNAAHGLLARIYLNRGVYTNPAATPTFSTADMNKVIEHANVITGKQLDFYWNNFGPNNGQISKEIVFSVEAIGGVRSTALPYTWYATFPGEIRLSASGGGWNGLCTLKDFYNTFETADIRRFYASPITARYGYNVGFLIGQQKDQNGNPLPNVILTPEVPTIVGATLYNGIRPVKYIPDLDNMGSNKPDNDWILIRWADVLLMKAEALLRKEDEPAARAIVNQIRTNRNVGAFTTLTLDNLYAERGRELYWEGLRRMDMIRFGKFNAAWELKPVSERYRNIFPIPREDVIANPNITQNPGYPGPL